MVKLQHLSVLFIALMLPISLIMFQYTQIQIDTLTLQNKYDTKLMDATYDAVKAFEINTTQNNIVNVADTLKEDIEAAISTFMESLRNNFQITAYSADFIKPYVPAMLFTLYDGYYIYAPTPTEDEAGFQYMLQPYNYYSVRYKHGNIDIVVNYTLDNYVVVYGYLNVNDENSYIVESGYLIDYNNVPTVKTEREIYMNVPVAYLSGTTIAGAGIQRVNVADTTWNSPIQPNGRYLYERNELYYIDANSANSYYAESKAFSDWFHKNFKNITAKDAWRNGVQISTSNPDSKIFDIGPGNNPEDKASNFNQHKMEIIESSIKDNLNQAITIYSNSYNDETKYNFRMPDLQKTEWEMICSNVCCVSFLQGLPIGTKYYNDYAIVKCSNNKLYVEPENLYYINQTNGDGNYHRIDCPHLGDTGDIVGFSNYTFQPFSQEIKGLANSKPWYYYMHPENACYYCIVSSTYVSVCGRNVSTGQLNVENLLGDRKTAYYTTLAREKYRNYTTTNYF